MRGATQGHVHVGVGYGEDAGSCSMWGMMEVGGGVNSVHRYTLTATVVFN